MLSIPHLVVLFLVALVVFGPEKLPELARTLGRLMADFRKASGDFRSALENEMRDLESQAREAQQKIGQAALPAVSTSPTAAETTAGDAVAPESVPHEAEVPSGPAPEQPEGKSPAEPEHSTASDRDHSIHDDRQPI